MSSDVDDVWSVVSLDELSDDALSSADATGSGGVNDDDDDDDDDLATSAAGDVQRRRNTDLAPLPPSSTTMMTTTTRTKSVKTKPTRSVARRNERERNRVRQVNNSEY